MKSIFKKIAFVLALAMVVTMMPAKAAAAAESDGPQMYTTLRLYIGGDVTETYADQRYAKVWDKDGYSVEFESSDTSVATVNSKGYVRAVSVGSALVTATFTAEDGSVVERECEVTVKKNAVAAGLSSASTSLVQEEGIPVGETIQLTAVRKDADGNMVWNGRDVITDGVRFLSSNEEVFTVQKTTGKITGVAEGEATLYVWAVQSEGQDKETLEYPATTPKKEYTVKVVNGSPVVTNATVKSVTTIELEVKGVTAENVKDLKITNEFGGDIKTLFKDPVLSEDGTTVTVEKYVQLVNDEKLNFSFGEEEPFQLTVQIGEVANVVLVGPSAVVVGADPADIDIRLLDENGVELALDLSRITFKVSDETFAYAGDGKISIFQVGKVVTLDATYNTGKFDENWNLIELKSNQITVTGVEAATIVAQEMLFNKENKDYSANPVKIYVNGNDKLYAQVTLSDKDGTKVNSNDNASAFSFETLDPSVLLVDAATGKLVPVKTGTARILVKFEYNNAKINGIATIQVLEAPKLVSVVADKPSIAISNAAGVESAGFTFTGKDQYGQDFSANITKIDALTQPANGNLTWDGGTGVGTNKLTFSGNGVQVAGTYTYRVYVADNVSVVVSVVVKKPAENPTAASYKFVAVSGNVEVNPSEIADDDFAKYQFRIVAQDGAGVAFKVVDDDANVSVKIGDTSYTATKGIDNIYTVDFVTTGSAIGVVSGSAVTVSDLHGNEGNVIANGKGYTVGEGDFVITGDLTVDGVKRVIIPLTGNITIKKGAPSVVATTAVVTATNATQLDEIKAVLKTNDAKYTVLDLANGDVLNTGLTGGKSFVLVKSVKVAEDLGNGNFVIHTVNLNQYFSVTITP